jgi:hypothetical protein
MPIEHIVSLLVAERDRLSRAIEALQGPTKRRGRPPETLKFGDPMSSAETASLLSIAES